MIKRIRRFRERRHDKLQLWALITIGAAVPAFLCWALPNMLADQRTNQRFAEATATQSAIVAFRAAHPDYFALCDSPVTDQQLEAGAIPSSQTILVLQNGAISDFQAVISAGWQSTGEADPTVLVCLGMERSLPIEECANGSMPDLTQLQPEVGGGQGNPRAPQPQVSLTHYVTAAAVYNLQTRELIAQETLYGSDPTYCEDSDGSLAGERVTSAAFEVWLAGVIGQ